MGTERVTFSTRRFLVGKAGPFPRLVFREEVMLALDQFSHLHSEGEHGGFLIGRKHELKTAEQYELTVERFVPIPQRSDASRLVIHQDHYRTVELALKNGEEVLGWAHTHPGFGVFLSNFDKQQHQRFFPEPWQIAYIMDNQAQERAVYRLVDDEWRRLDGYYVLRDMAENEVGITSGARTGGPWLRVLATVLTILVLVAGVAIGWPLVRDLLTEPEPAGQLAVEPEPVVQQAQTEETSTPSVVDAAPSEVETEPRVVTITPPPTIPRYVDYVVQRGDTLWSIAGKLWGDPSLFRLIAEENDIANPSSIRVGRVLRVPADPHQR
jgi:proteasome lid subunit RPN8/RPN11/LysM repeat protein